MSRELEAWLKEGRHLPAAMRDFHAQKALFGAMHVLQDAGNTGASHPGCARTEFDELFAVSAVAGHAYVVDRFLWFMARRGWTLQRSRADLPFSDLASDVEAVRRARSEQFRTLNVGRRRSSDGSD